MINFIHKNVLHTWTKLNCILNALAVDIGFWSLAGHQHDDNFCKNTSTNNSNSFWKAHYHHHSFLNDIVQVPHPVYVITDIKGIIIPLTTEEEFWVNIYSLTSTTDKVSRVVFADF